MNKVDPRIVEAAKQITAKRAKTVIDHILKHGFITTEDLKNTYGYDHPPRAARDVREQGIPLETFAVQAKNGRSIAAYRFGSWESVEGHKLGGRSVLPKQLKKELYGASGGRCYSCGARYEERYLSIDHRVPYEVSGEPETIDAHEFMLLCGSCQRSKSWSCEHCENWRKIKKESICRTCIWASPEKYEHVAMIKERRVTVVWSGDEVADAEALEQEAKKSGEAPGDTVKRLIKSLRRS